METYIALLRGINVSGQKKIQMAELGKRLQSSGLSNVRTYIQSGNIVFDHVVADLILLQDKIEQSIREYYGFDVKCCVFTPSALYQALIKNPFIDNPEKDPGKVYFVFLMTMPAPDRIAELGKYDYSPEEYEVGERCIYLYVANGFGRARMNNNFFENKLGITATTRNLNTVRKLLAMTRQE